MVTPHRPSSKASSRNIAEDLAKAKAFLDKLFAEKVLSGNQHRLFVAALSGFGGGWNEVVLDRAYRAITRLNAKDDPRGHAQVFLHGARGVLPQVQKKTQIAFRFIGVFLEAADVAWLEALVYIFFAARDQHKLLDSI